jgi:hypothetical protein
VASVMLCGWYLGDVKKQSMGNLLAAEAVARRCVCKCTLLLENINGYSFARNNQSSAINGAKRAKASPQSTHVGGDAPVLPSSRHLSEAAAISIDAACAALGASSHLEIWRY